MKIANLVLAIAMVAMGTLIWAQPAPPQLAGGGGFAGGGGDFGPGQGPPPWAVGPGGDDNGPGWGPDVWEHPEIRKKLNLTDDQVAKLQENRLQIETERIEHRAKMEIARLKMESLLQAKAFDDTAIDKQIDEIGDLHKQSIKMMVKQKKTLKEILTGEQMDKVDKFLNAARERIEERGPGLFGGQGKGRGGQSPFFPGGQGERVRPERLRRGSEGTPGFEMKKGEDGRGRPGKALRGEAGEGPGFGGKGLRSGEGPGAWKRGEGGPEGRGRMRRDGKGGPGFPPGPPPVETDPDGKPVPPPPPPPEKGDLGDSLEGEVGK